MVTAWGLLTGSSGGEKQLHPWASAPLSSDLGLGMPLVKSSVSVHLHFLENLSASAVQPALVEAQEKALPVPMPSETEHRNTTGPKLPVQKISLVQGFPEARGTCLAHPFIVPTAAE